MGGTAFVPVQGKLLSPGTHFDLSMQAPQPLFQIASRVAVSVESSAAGGATSVKFSHVEASIRTDSAYQGLSCLSLKGESAACSLSQKPTRSMHDATPRLQQHAAITGTIYMILLLQVERLSVSYMPPS